MTKVLVTGATGYVGGRLVRELIDSGLEVRVFVRDPKKVTRHNWSDEVEVATGSASNYEDVRAALRGIDVAYYLLHSMSGGKNFHSAEKDMASNFSRAATDAGIKQIVYLGGIANDKRRSEHLQSRLDTGQILAQGLTPVLELRSGIIIGSGSASFEMLRHLTHRLPLMTTPKWVKNKTQPIAIRDVLYYLVSCTQLSKPCAAIYDIGGPEILSYEEMMQKFAHVSGLRKRIVIKVPVLTPWLSSLWIGLVTPVPSSLARPLVESLISEVIVDQQKNISELISPPPTGLLPVEKAIELALERVDSNAIQTRWADAVAPASPWQRAQSDPDWSGATEFVDQRTRITQATPAALWATIEKIGGETGWYGAGWLWSIRGFIDRLFGGVGLRRGRRHPLKLQVGDSLDFWRVEKIEHEKELKLYAEMILPGKAWLEFQITPESSGVRVTQTATFQPRGLGGHLYWHAVSPFHLLVFPTMLRNICKQAELESRL